MDVKVSAIIPSRNRTVLLRKCISTLLDQSVPFHEIIVVDDCSTDSTSADIKMQFGDRVKLFTLKEHLERSKARNFGASQAEGNVIAFMDDDCLYNKEWNEGISEGFEKGFKAGIDRRRVLEPRTFIGKLNDHVFELRHRRYVPFSAWAFDKVLFEQLKGFDESLNCSEDKDLGDRILASGNKIYFSQKSVQLHKGEPQSLKEAIHRSYWFGRNIHMYWKKHPEQKHFLKIFMFTALILSAILIPFTMIFFTAMVALIYAYLFLKALRQGMSPQFLFLYPFVVAVTELFFVLGWYRAVFFPSNELNQRN